MNIFLQMAIVFAVSLVVTLAMVPVSKRIAFALGAVDYPSNRRINTQPVPRCGGIALYVGFMAGLAVLYFGTHVLEWKLLNTYFLQSFNYPLLLLGITAMFCTGLVDDVRQLSPHVKFLFQVIAAIIVAASGVSIGSFYLIGQGFVQLGFWDMPLTVIYLVVFVNITNLIDGLDGLAAGIVGICSLALMVLVIERGSITLACVCICLFGTCLGFLRYNFHPASVFMGDSGSLFLGLMVGIISLTGVVRMQSIVVLAVPVIIAGVPIIDTSSAVIRRLVNHRPIDEPDLQHIHHRLMKQGFDQKTTVIILYAITLLMVVVALLLSNTGGMVRTMATGIILVIGVVLVFALGIAKPVLQHHYDNKGKTGKRKPPSKQSEDEEYK